MIAELIKYKEFRKVAYYTIQVIGRKHTEFDDFIHRMNAIKAYQPELRQIIQFVNDIGDRIGAHKYHFRHERSAEALPPPHYQYIDVSNDKKKFGLRLYCIRLSDSIVILLNGDMKTAQRADDCPNCGKHFRTANKVANQVQNAIVEKIVRLSGKKIILQDDFELNI